MQQALTVVVTFLQRIELFPQSSKSLLCYFYLLLVVVPANACNLEIIAHVASVHCSCSGFLSDGGLVFPVLLLDVSPSVTLRHLVALRPEGNPASFRNPFGIFAVGLDIPLSSPDSTSTVAVELLWLAPRRGNWLWLLRC